MNDPKSIDNIDARTPTRVFTTPTSRGTPINHVLLIMQQEMNEAGFWNLPPKDILRKVEGWLIDSKRPRKQFFSHLRLEPPLPGYYQYFWGVNAPS